MNTTSSATHAPLMHMVTLACRDAQQARRCLEALGTHGKRDAFAFNCQSYEFGLKEGTTDTVYLVERWNRWEDLDSLLTNKVVPALPLYNQFLKRPFDPAKDTVRITLSQG